MKYYQYNCKLKELIEVRTHSSGIIKTQRKAIRSLSREDISKLMGEYSKSIKS